MFKNSSLALKIAFGFTVMLIIAAILGYSGWHGVNAIAAKVGGSG